MLKKDQVCEKCNWVASYLYDIKGIKYHYCFNCFTQKKSPPIELIFTNKNISKREKFTIKTITRKRAGSGISAIKWKSILGKKAKKKYYIDEII